MRNKTSTSPKPSKSPERFRKHVLVNRSVRFIVIYDVLCESRKYNYVMDAIKIKIAGKVSLTKTVKETFMG